MTQIANYYSTSGDPGDPNQADASNGTPDWWEQNAPPPPQAGGAQGLPNEPASFDWSNVKTDGTMKGFNPDGTPHYNQPMPGYDADHNPYGGSWQLDDASGAWGWRTLGNPNRFDAQNNEAVALPAGGSSWGGPVAPFDQTANPYPTFTPPPLPDYLQKGFALPSAEELQNSPGYMERYNMGRLGKDRGFAARGTILNGGTQKALNRYGQDYASGEYSNLVNQKLGERQQQSNDYLNLAYGPAWQTNTAAVNQYGQMYGQYRNLLSDNRNAQSDFWNQQMDLLNAGLRAASGGAPGGTGGQG